MDFSFLWAKGSDEQYEIIEVTFDSGPLNMMLGYDQHTRKIYVHGFQPTPDGRKGVAEASGQIRLRDELISVNAKEINGASLRWTVNLIMKSLWPMTLQFRRPANQANAMLQEYIDVEKLSKNESNNEIFSKGNRETSKGGRKHDRQQRSPRSSSATETHCGPDKEKHPPQLPLTTPRDFAPGITAALDRVLGVVGENNVQLINQAARLDAALVRVKKQTTARVRGMVAFHKEFEKLPALKQEVMAISAQVRELKVLLQMTEEALLQKEKKKIVKDFARQGRSKSKPEGASSLGVMNLTAGQVASRVGSSIVEQFSTVSKSVNQGEGFISRATAALFGVSPKAMPIEHQNQDVQQQYITYNTKANAFSKMGVPPLMSIEDILVENEENELTQVDDNNTQNKSAGGEILGHNPIKNDDDDDSNSDSESLLALNNDITSAEPVTELDRFYDNPW